MRAWLALLIIALAVPAYADGLTQDTLAQTARLSGDAMIATSCKLRPESWYVVAVPAISIEIGRRAKNLDPSGGLSDVNLAAFVDGAMNQAVDEGVVQWTRYGQATCKAIQDDGSLAQIDALVAGLKKPGH